MLPLRRLVGLPAYLPQLAQVQLEPQLPLGEMSVSLPFLLLVPRNPTLDRERGRGSAG